MTYIFGLCGEKWVKVVISDTPTLFLTDYQ